MVVIFKPQLLGAVGVQLGSTQSALRICWDRGETVGLIGVAPK